MNTLCYTYVVFFISSADQKRMIELVSYLSRQRTRTPPEKADKQKSKEVGLICVTMSYLSVNTVSSVF